MDTGAWWASPCACKESDTTEQLILSLTLGKTSGEGLRLTNEDPAHRPGAGPPEGGQRGVEFSSVAWSWLTLGDTMDCSTSGFPVHHQLQRVLGHWKGSSFECLPSSFIS